MNTTTILERDQILDLCEMIHTSRSGNLSGSRIPCPRVVPLYPSHFVDAQTQSHPRVTGRHPHGFPIHHLEGDYGLHSLDRRGPPSLGARHGGPRPRPPVHHRRYSGALLVMVEASRTVLRQAPHNGSEPASGLHPDRTARLDPQNHQQAVCMTQRPSRNPDSSQPSMLTIISGTRATSDWG